MSAPVNTSVIPSEAGNLSSDANTSLCGNKIETLLPIAPSVYFLAAAAVLIHFLFNRQYGYFRDELYYAACGERLAWGYVDHAPLVAFASAFTRALFGDSLFALRLLPALSSFTGWQVYPGEDERLESELAFVFGEIDRGSDTASGGEVKGANEVEAAVVVPVAGRSDSKLY